MSPDVRFPVSDGLGIYCWFCSEMLDTEKADATCHSVGDGRYRTICPSCGLSTYFDRQEELAPRSET